MIEVDYVSHYWSDLTQNLNLSSLGLGDQTEVYRDLKRRQLPMEDNLKNQKCNISSTPGQFGQATKLKSTEDWHEDNHHWKATSNIKIWIYQQSFIGSYPNFKWINLKSTEAYKWAPMEDDLKEIKVQYLSNH